MTRKKLLPALLFLLSTIVYAQPPNNNCSNAISIASGQIEDFNTSNATEDIYEGSCSVGYEVWYVFTPTKTAIFDINTCGSSFDTKLATYLANSCSEVDFNSQLECNDDGCTGSTSQLYLSATLGETYYIEVGGFSSSKGIGELLVEEFTTEPNDLCADAIEVFEDIPDTFNNTQTTNDDISTSCSIMYNDLWYSFTPTTSKTFRAKICATNYDLEPNIAIYQTSNCTSITDNSELICSSSSASNGCSYSSVETLFEATAAITYYVRLGCRSGDYNVGAGELLIEEFVAEPNDLCTDAIEVFENTPEAFNNTNTTDDNIFTSCSSIGNDLWYTFTPTASKPFTVTACSNNNELNPRFAVYEVSNCNSITNYSELICGEYDNNCAYNGQEGVFSGTLGSTYYIRVGSYFQNTGDGTLLIQEFVTAPNDLCTGAIEVFENTPKAFNNSNTTSDNISTNCSSIYNDLWYSFTPTATKSFTAQVCGTNNYDLEPNIAIYETSNCNSIQDYSEIACGEYSSNCSYNGREADFLGNVGSTYYIRVGNMYGSSYTGEGSFVISEFGGAANDLCENAIEITQGETMFFDNEETTNDGFETNCSEIYNDLWYSFTPVTSDLYRVSTCNSAFNTKLAVYNTNNCSDISDYSEIGCNDDNNYCSNSSNATLYFNATAGQTYFVRVGSYYSSSNSTGNILIELNANSVVEFSDYEIPAKVFPNPSKNGNITIEFEYSLLRNIKLLDSMGKEVYAISTSNATQKINMLKKPSSGIYTLHITEEETGNQTIQRLIIE
jgi:hypothetical protein